MRLESQINQNKSNIINPSFIEFICGNLVKEIEELDNLKIKGQEIENLESLVNDISEKARHCFGIWLVHKGFEKLSFTYPYVLKSFFSFIYLDKKHIRLSLRTIRKKSLEGFLNTQDPLFIKSMKEGSENQLDGILSIYNFLDEIGYPVYLPRKEKAIRQLKKEFLNV